MVPHPSAPTSTAAEFPSHSDRRYGNRTPAFFSLLYSGMGAGQMLVGDGFVTNLSPCGIGIRGNRLVTPGMEIALFIDLPGLKEPLCIAQSRVCWVAGSHFGVELGSLKLEEKKQLHFFLWDRATPTDHDKDV